MDRPLSVTVPMPVSQPLWAGSSGDTMRGRPRNRSR